VYLVDLLKKECPTNIVTTNFKSKEGYLHQREYPLYLDPRSKDSEWIQDYKWSYDCYEKSGRHRNVFHVLTYSWAENLYDIIRFICYETDNSTDIIPQPYHHYVWIDIINIDQNNNTSNALNSLRDIYKVSTSYIISSEKAFSRYWCCFELSIVKKAENQYFTCKPSSMNENIYERILNVVTQNKGFLKEMVQMENYLSVISAVENLKKNSLTKKFIHDLCQFNFFDINNAGITLESDKVYINKSILEVFKSLEDYDNFIELTILEIYLLQSKEYEFRVYFDRYCDEQKLSCGGFTILQWISKLKYTIPK